MAKFFLSVKAFEDLSDIWNYTCDHWSESQADKYYELLINTCQQLSEQTSNGKHYYQIGNDILGFHVGKHIIFYREKNSAEILILRILHESMDLKSRMAE